MSQMTPLPCELKARLMVELTALSYLAQVSIKVNSPLPQCTGVFPFFPGVSSVPCTPHLASARIQPAHSWPMFTAGGSCVSSSFIPLPCVVPGLLQAFLKHVEGLSD